MHIFAAMVWKCWKLPPSNSAAPHLLALGEAPHLGISGVALWRTKPYSVQVHHPITGHWKDCFPVFLAYHCRHRRCHHHYHHHRHHQDIGCSPAVFAPLSTILPDPNGADRGKLENVWLCIITIYIDTTYLQCTSADCHSAKFPNEQWPEAQQPRLHGGAASCSSSGWNKNWRFLCWTHWSSHLTKPIAALNPEQSTIFQGTHLGLWC